MVDLPMNVAFAHHEKRDTWTSGLQDRKLFLRQAKVARFSWLSQGLTGEFPHADH